MKKLTMVALVLAMAFAMASSASALYTWNVAGSNTSGGAYVSGVIGYTSTAGVTAYTAASPFQNAALVSVVYTGTPTASGSFTKTALNKFDRRTTDPGTWILAGFPEASYPNSTFDIRIWSSGATMATQGMNLYKLYDPTTQTWGRDLLNTTGPIMRATAGSVTDPWFKTTLNTPTLKGSPMDANGAYIFELSPVPEPGSLVALMSGLVGLVGFGIRRRK